MRVEMFFAAVSVCLSACMSTQAALPTTEHPIAAAVSDELVPPSVMNLRQATRPPGWAILCQETAKDGFGDIKQRGLCEVTARYYDDDLLKFIGDYGLYTIFPVLEHRDHGGIVVLPSVIDSPGCPAKSRVAVDGVQIRDKPINAQISALLNGKLLLVDDVGPWPRCSHYVGATFLDGLRDGYEEMEARWKARQGG